ncbi:glycosyltransferase family 2 protein [Methylobacterium sp. M6A4_1b]
MKVKHLLQWTEWKPGKDYALAMKPELSILLPTFRRGQDGLFLRVVRNILDQSFSDIELIIIDDASTDGTAEIISDIMLDDGRVSCLTHKKNIGLPAVSEYEAYIRARGNFIGFGFDDFIFENNAFFDMMSSIREGEVLAAFGNVGLQLSADHQIRLGNICPLDDIIFKNFIGNSSVIVHRDIIESVGFYDPHVAVTRICDWDLWRRILKDYEIKSTNVMVGRELGASRSDSLGNTYPMYPEIIQEFIDEDRNNDLKPRNFPERDIFLIPKNASIPLRSHIEVSRDFFSSKTWYSRPTKSDAGVARKRISLFAGNYTRNHMVWGGSDPSKDLHIGWIESNPDTFHEKSSLLSSDVVIFSGNLGEDQNVRALSYCLRHRIPTAYFIDEFAPVIGWLPRSKKTDEVEEFVITDLQIDSNFEEILPGGRIKGWAYEGGSSHADLIVFVDGVVCGLIKANIPRGDLLAAGIGNGNHAFYYDLPIEFHDGKEHVVEIKFAFNLEQLRNSPVSVALQQRSEAEFYRKNLPLILCENELSTLKKFDLLIASSSKICNAVPKISNDRKVHIASPSISRTRLERQRRILPELRESLGVTRVLVQPSANKQWDMSPIDLVLRDNNFVLQSPSSSFGEHPKRVYKFMPHEASSLFNESADYLTRWGADLAILQGSGSDNSYYRSDSVILYCLYIGVVPVVSDQDSFVDWNGDHGVYRVDENRGGWSKGFEILKDPVLRKTYLQRLEKSCLDRFAEGKNANRFESIFENIPSMDFQLYFNRFRSGWRELYPP